MAAPIPIAVRLESGVTLRGHEWDTDGLPVLFIHDLGEDLDAWGTVPTAMSKSGFRVMSVELRGHGLSDGEPDPSVAVDDVRDLVAEVAGSFGPIAVVLHGGVSEAAFWLNPDVGSPVQIMISPQPLDPEGIDWSKSAKSMRLVLVGARHDVALEYAQQIHPKMQGQNLLASTGTTDQGPALLENHPGMLDQAQIFIRRYLAGHQMAWITEHADEIKAAARSREE